MTAVVVLGHGGGGTSVVAGTLHGLGVRMGPKDAAANWEYRNWANPMGTFENSCFFILNRKILGVWDTVGLAQIVTKSEFHGRATALRGEIERVVRENEGTLWGWKDARSLFTIEHYIPFLQDPRFIFVQRNAASVLRTNRRKGEWIPASDAELLYTLEIERMNEIPKQYPGVPILSVFYDDLLRDPRTEVDRFAEFLGLHVSSEEKERALRMILEPMTLVSEARRLARREFAEYPGLFLADFATRVIQFTPCVKPTPATMLLQASGYNRFKATFLRLVRS